jgi:hypothetical protein
MTIGESGMNFAMPKLKSIVEHQSPQHLEPSFVLCRKYASMVLKGVNVVYKLLLASISKRCGSIWCIRNGLLILVHSESTYDLKVSFCI